MDQRAILTPHEILSHPEWLAHRFDETNDGFRFIELSRELHRAATFITDDYLKSADQFQFLSRQELDWKDCATGPVHFVFHSAYCCSTMVARAFDAPAISMGLKEPQVLNDILGWQRRGAGAVDIAHVLEDSLKLLGRPFTASEATIIKPSNIVSPMASQMLDLRPDAKAIFLYAPIESYLRSIAKKGLWGRRWVREVLIGTIKDGYMISGFEDQDLLELTDLQVAAVGWLSQHRLFASLVERYGSERIKTLDSATLLADHTVAVGKMFDHFDLALGAGELAAIASGPAFTTHSKDVNASFDAEARAREQSQVAQTHGEEIEKVCAWTEAVAASQGLRLALAGHLLGQ